MLLLREGPTRGAEVLCKLLKRDGIAAPSSGRLLREGFNAHSDRSFAATKADPHFDPFDC